jgi:thymidylate synthase (FAD)
MKIVDPSVEIIAATLDMGKVIERGLRQCYKSEDRICEGSDQKIFEQVVKHFHHDSVSEHASITFKITTSRAVMGQLTRHRIGASFSIESMRYNNYSKGKFGHEITVIAPYNYCQQDVVIAGTPSALWWRAMRKSERYYLELLEAGWKAEEAREVLPQSTKTEIVVTMNIRALRHFFTLRADKAAQKEIRIIAELMFKEAVKEHVPVWMLDDVVPQEWVEDANNED